MKIYIKNSSACYDYPSDMEQILDFLNKNGKLLCSEETVENMYREFSEDRYCAGWMGVDEDRLVEFADWLAEIDI